MELKELIATLPEGSVDYVLCADELAPVYTISFRTNTQRDPRPDVLYFADPTMLPAEVPADTFFNCVLIGGGAEDVPEALAANRNVNVLAVTQGFDPFALYNRLQDFFIEDAGVTAQIRQMLMALLANRGVQYLVEEAATALGNPLVVVDPSFRYIASHGFDRERLARASDDAASILAEEVEFGSVLERGVTYIRREGIDEQVARRHGRPLVEMNADLGITTMTGSVMVHGICVAHIMMVAQNHAFTFGDEQAFARLCPIMGQELQKGEVFAKSREQMDSFFLTSLLRDEQPSQAVTRRRLEVLGYKPLPTLFVAVLRLREPGPIGRQEQSLLGQLQPILTASLSTVLENELVLLLGRPARAQFSDFDQAALERIAAANELDVGVSNDFGDILDIRRHYDQARSAMDYGSAYTKVLANTHVYHYCDYNYMELFSLAEDRVNLLNYVHPAIWALYEHDRAHKSELLETLYAYMQNTANTARTAKLLSLHKNTLLYRIGRIKEILGNDLTSGEDLFLYHMSIRALIYLHIFEPRTRPETSASLHADGVA